MDVWSEWKEHDGGACPIPNAEGGEWEGRRVAAPGFVLRADGTAEFWTTKMVWSVDCSRQAPEAATPGTGATTGYPPDRGHQGVMHSDELGIALAELAGKRMRDDVGWIRSAFTSPGETKEAPPLPVAGFDHRLGAWR